MDAAALQTALRIPPSVQASRDAEASAIRAVEGSGEQLVPWTASPTGATPPLTRGAQGALSPGAASALRIPDLGAQWTAAANAKKAATGKVESAMQAKAGELGPLEERIKQAGASAPTAPTLDKVPDKFAYKGPTNEEINEQMMGLFAFAAVAGALTRTPMTAAMNAFSGGIKGMVEGDKLAYQRGMQEFDRNMKAAIAKNQEAVSEYKLAMEKNQGDIGNMMNEWRLIAAKHQDTVMLANLERQDADSMMKHIETAARASDQAERTRQQMERDSQRLQATIAGQDANRASRERMGADQIASRERVAAERLRVAEEALTLKKSQAAEKARVAAEKMPKAEQDKFNARNDLLADAQAVKDLLQSRPAGVGPETLLGDLVMSYWDEDGIPLRSALAKLQANYSFGQGGKALTATEREILAPVTEWRGKKATALEQMVTSLITQIDAGNADLVRRFPAAAGGASGVVATPPKNAKGWGLQQDAAGNKAYVGPNGEIEEVR